MRALETHCRDGIYLGKISAKGFADFVSVIRVNDGRDAHPTLALPSTRSEPPPGLWRVVGRIWANSYAVTIRDR